jgi:predicted nucleotidyltransferase
LALLFGSFAKGVEMKESDFDVAVYFKNYHPLSSPLAQLKKPKAIRELERKIWFKITQLIHKEGLVCLNEAPTSLISDIFQIRTTLKIKDKRLYWELYLNKSLEAEDFSEFLKEFFEIKQKAKSLIPKQKERLRIRFDYLNDEMEKNRPV